MNPDFKTIVTEVGLRISGKMPGLHDSDLEVTVDGATLRVVSKGSSSSDPFQSVLAVPPGYDAVKARVAYLHGELHILLPKA